MKNILVIGSSHVGAIKQSLQHIDLLSNSSENIFNYQFAATVGGQAMVFQDKKIFADRNPVNYNNYWNYFKQLGTACPSFATPDFFLKNFRLVAGVDTLSIDQFYSVVLVGSTSPLEIRHYFHESTHELIPFSDSLLKSIVKSVIFDSLNQVSVFSQLLSSSIGVPIFWIPDPCEPVALNHSLKKVSCSVPRWKTYKYMQSLDIPCNIPGLESLYQRIDDISQVIAKDFDLSHILLPPLSVLSESCFQTKEDYSIGSKHFAEENKLHPDLDPHMNSVYGLKILEKLNQFL